MTDRIAALTVILEEDMRPDAMEPLRQAIKQLRGVLDVTGVCADPTLYIALQRARRELREELRGVLESNL
jgi:hypothetical protein